uniref:Uncharacterized protein n=1 Tax=Trichuris muris TaxID=70415 RepID=A0A5S6Q6K6_TRIMR
MVVLLSPRDRPIGCVELRFTMGHEDMQCSAVDLQTADQQMRSSVSTATNRAVGSCSASLYYSKACHRLSESAYRLK